MLYYELNHVSQKLKCLGPNCEDLRMWSFLVMQADGIANVSSEGDIILE